MQTFTRLQEVRKTHTSKDLRAVHERAMTASLQLKRCEAELIKALQAVDEKLVHRFIGYNSLFQYAVQALGLTEHQAYMYISVARKAKELPSLQSAIERNELTVSKAKRVTGVITKENQAEWLELARTASKAELEKAVARVNPQLNIQEGAKYITEDTLDLRVAVSEETYQKLTRAKELLMQNGNQSLDEVLNTVLTQYLKRHDPVEKAQRAQLKRSKSLAHACESVALSSNAESCKKETRKETSTDETPSKHRHQPLQTVQPEYRTLQSSKPQHRPLQAARAKQKNSDLNRTVRGPGLVRNQSQAPARVKITLRSHIPAAIRHAVYLRDRGACQYRIHNQTCGSRVRTELHHVLPVSAGGDHSLKNLTTLCRAHHQLLHL